MHEDDDLTGFEDSPLVRALRAPGTATEHAGEDEAVAAFRATRTPGPTVVPPPEVPAGRGGRWDRWGRFGASGVAMATVVALTGGVAAAAYTQSLPAPVQKFAHENFRSLGVPSAPDPDARAERRPAAPAPTPSPGRTGAPSPAPSPSPSGHPSGGQSLQPAPGTSQAAPPSTPDATSLPDTSAAATLPGALGTPGPTVPAPSGSASGSPSPPASPSLPTGTPPAPPVSGLPPVPSALPAPVLPVRLVLDVPRVVPVGAEAPVTGTVRDLAGATVAGRQVEMLVRRVDGSWTSAGTATSGAEGTVAFSVPAMSETTWVRLRTVGDQRPGRAPERTRPARIRVKPGVLLRATGPHLQVIVSGGRPGDAVQVFRARKGNSELLANRQLDQAGVTSYDLSGLTGRVKVVVRVLRSKTHARARAVLVLRLPPAPTAPAAPTSSVPPSPSTTPNPTPTHPAPGTPTP